LTTSRVPDAPDTTMTPLKVWRPLLVAPADAEIANAIATAASAAAARLIGGLILSPPS
jgi:hypothetical protein